MRIATAIVLGTTLSLAAALSAVQAQSISGVSAAAKPGTALAAAPSGAPVATGCANPNGLGISRTVEIDTTGGPGFGFEHFKQHDFLRAGEIVLTFDDGPWPVNTPAVLAALASHCSKATFFPIGKHSVWHPDILKQVAAGGHTIGNHTWSHVDLSKKSVDEAKDEIEKGISAVRMALGAQQAPFFRFPALKHPPELVVYLGERGVAMFSTDLDSFDFTMRKPEQVVAKVMQKLKTHGKGIVLMHDFQQATAKALPDLLTQLKANGYKLVHMKAKDPLQSLAAYDAVMTKDAAVGIQTVSTRPTSSVVRSVD